MRLAFAVNIFGRLVENVPPVEKHAGIQAVTESLLNVDLLRNMEIVRFYRMLVREPSSDRYVASMLHTRISYQSSHKLIHEFF